MDTSVSKYLVLLCLSFCVLWFHSEAITGDKITTDVQYDEGNLACLNESVTYFCTVTDALRLDWIIPPMITSSDPIRFLASNTVGLTDSKGQFNGNLTSLNASLSDPNRANITSTLSFVAYTSLNGSLIECLSDVSRVMSIVFITEIPSQLTGLTCSLEDPICGLLNTATVLCTWYILPGEIRPVFFTVHLPNGTEDVIPGTETSYSFVHSYAERGPENVTFTSNCNNDGGVFYDLQTLFGEYQNVCFTGPSLTPVAAVVVIILTAPIVLMLIIIAVLMPYRLKAINKEISDLSYSPAKQKLEEDIEHHVSDTGSELWYHISWSVRLKLAKQCVTIHQYEVSKKMIVERENCKGHYYDFSCKPGSQYEVSVETKSSCYDPLRRKKVFLTEVTLPWFIGDREIELDCDPTEDMQRVEICKYKCGQNQRVKETYYKHVQLSGKAAVKESTISSHGTERSFSIPFTQKKQSGQYHVILETLPILASTSVLSIPKVERSFNIILIVYPRTPEDVKCTDIKPHSVKLCWEQIYRCDDEKPTEYLVKIVGKPNMSGPITPIVCEILSAKYRYKCEHILKSLEPGNTYTLVITAKIGDYAKHSAEVVIATTPLPVKPAKPSIETITPTTAVFTGDLRKKRENEIYTLVICSGTGEKVDSKQLSGRGGRETISTKLLAPDTQYSACLRASLQIDQSEDITADGESLLFTTTADICSFTVNPTRPELGAEVQFTASYQVNLNNVDVFCIIPDGKSLPPCGTSVPDDKSVVKATFVVADARSGKYTVSIASFLPGDKTYPIKKSTAVKSLKVTCSVPTDSSLDVTVPEKMVTSVSAEIQWMIHIHPNLFADSHAKLVVNPEAQMTVTNTQYMKELDSINGSFEFPNLQPSTSYCASLIITYPGVKDPVTKKMDPFKTKGAPVKPPPPKCVHITVDEAILEFDTSLVLVHEKCFCSLYNATKKVEVCREEVKKDRVKVFVSPKTKYEARLIVCISKFPNYITKSDPEVFDVPDYEPHVDLDFSDGIATLTVDPPLPKSAMVVIKANSGVWGSYVTVKKVKATEKNVFDMTNPKYPEAMHIVQLVLGKREEYTPCGTFTTPKAKGAGHGGGDLDSIYK